MQSHSPPSVTGSWTVSKISGTSLGSQWIWLGMSLHPTFFRWGLLNNFQGHREVSTLFWEKLPASAQMRQSWAGVIWPVLDWRITLRSSGSELSS